MATQMVNLRLEDRFLKEIDLLVKKGNYQSRTEFIRAAMREKVDEVKLEEARTSIAHLLGAGKRKVQTSDEELERIREEVGKRFPLSKKESDKLFRSVGL
jgi:Arc/MetJ-type ribon-helix-helix transcriptional regulator